MLLKTITGLSALLSVILLALGCFGIVWLVPVFAGIWLGLAIIALAFLWIVCALVDLDKPQEEDDPVYRSIMYVYIEALMNLVLVRLHTRGWKIPRRKAGSCWCATTCSSPTRASCSTPSGKASWLS